MIKSKETLEDDEYQRAYKSTDLSNCTPHSGYLSRKSSKGFWQRRWFYLNNQFLIYKKDEKTVESKGVLSLHEISAINTNANVLEMTMGDGSYKLLLRGASNEEMKCWESRIYERIAWYNSQLQEVTSIAEKVEHPQLPPENLTRKTEETSRRTTTSFLDGVSDSTLQPPINSLTSPPPPASTSVSVGPAKEEYRQLVVELVKAENLIGCTKNGLSCPVVTLKLLGHNGQEIPDQTATSHQRVDTISPVWEQVFVFGSKDFGIHVSALSMPSLQLEVYHKPESLVVVEKPMGQTLIPLSTVRIDGTPREDWFKLEKAGRMVAVSGQLRLKLKWIKLPAEKAKDIANAQLAAAEKKPSQQPFKRGISVGSSVKASESTRNKGNTDGKTAMTMSQYQTEELYKDLDPNELVVTVFRCQNLRWTKKKGLPDPIVNLKLNDAKKQWNIKMKTTNPVYNDTYFFKVKDPSMSLTVSIEYNELVKNTFVGQTVISLRPLQNKQMVKQWYKLRNIYGQVSAVDLGNVELGLIWRYNPEMTGEADKKLLGGINILKGFGLGSDSDTDVSDEEEDESTTMLEAISAEVSEKVAIERAKVDNALFAELGKVRLKGGSYQVQVHILEARELVAKNLNGLSDPVVFVEVNGEKQKTITYKNCLSAVYDELFLFNLKHMEKEELERIEIHMKVFDANVLTKSVLIGSYSIDLEAVYLSKDHEKYRQWVGLINNEDPTANSYQGFLKFSVQVVGEDEVAKVHNEEEENRKEEALQIKNGCPLVGVLAPPNIVKQWVFLVVAVYEADYLPVMDRSFLAFKKDGTDAYAELQFSSNQPVRTRVKTLKGSTRENMSPTFNYELWVPVSIPSSSQHISFSMWDHDIGVPNELIGTHYTSLKRLLMLPRDPATGHDKSTGLYWANIYGAHKSTRDEVFETVKKGVTTAHSAIHNTLLDRDYKEYYNRTPALAPSYNGRVLISQRIAFHYDRPKKYLSDNMEPFMRSIRKLSPQLLPAVRKYKLKALLVRGSDLPSLRGEVPGSKEVQKLQVMVSIGKHEIVSKQVNCVGRICQWGELMESEDLLLPEDLTQLPDIFVYLVTAFAETATHRDPICFKRFSVQDILNQNFQGPCEWILLNKDHIVNGITDTERPGNLLIKLGFGPSEEEVSHRAEWESALLRQKRRTPYQIRVHLYQGKDFPATDDNGLSDPYLKLNLLGEMKQSTIKNKTRFPLYYETITFDCLLPDKEYMPLLDCQVYDKDLIFDDFVGRFSYPLSEAFELEAANDDLPDPHYIPIFIEKPGDGQGEVLMSVQLLQKGPDVVLPPPPSLVPDTRLAFIEITALGLRNMQPYKFQKMVSPFVEVFVQSIGGKHLVGTDTSKSPSPMNPNYLEQFTVEVKLPRNALYSVPLMLIARDVRMGGLLRPEVGIAYVDITNKIPWAKNYIPPQSNVFFQNEFGMSDGFSGTAHQERDAVIMEENLDAVGKEALAIQLKNNQKALEDDFILTQNPVDVSKLVRKRMEEEDSGVGVFGALAHLALPEYGGHRKITAEDYFADIDWEEEDSDEDSPPKYMEGRTVLDQELERKLKNSPFESYKLCRGSKSGLFPTFKENVGIFKGLVRVYVDENNPPPFDMAQLRVPQAYVCRLYVLRGLNLTPMDPGFGGRPGKSDPYLKVKLGDVIFDDRENAVDDATDVDFYKMIEFGCELPGISQLTLQVYDHDIIGSDDLIGETVIDLEDRWFDQKWQQIGGENRREPSGAADEEPRWNTKDLERRTLYVPTSNASQGIVECWLDIMSPGEASVFPPDDVALPPREVFEVRLVIWKCKDVPAADTFGGQDMTDMYIRSWIEGCDLQETDTHWRAKKGKGSFNWRMKFDVELGHNTRAMKFPYLHLQLWDRDLLKWNDCMAEATVNLGAYFRKAFKKQVAIKLFETDRGSSRVKRNRKKRARLERKAQSKLNLKNFDVPDTPPPEEKNENVKDENTELDEGAEVVHPEDKDSSGDKNNADLVNEGAAENSPSFFSYFRRKPKYAAAQSSDENAPVTEDTESTPLLSPVSEEEEDEEDSEALEFVKSIQNMTGLWDNDPNDSTWLFMDRLDHETGIREPMGKLCYSLQIWPKKVAKLMPVGNGQQSPNQDPFLPPPTGRLQFSWNPFVMGASLCGPKLCCQLCCCLLCIGFAILMIFCQPVINVLIAVLIP